MTVQIVNEKSDVVNSEMEALEQLGRPIPLALIPRGMKKEERADFVRALTDQFRFVLIAPTDDVKPSIEFAGQAYVRVVGLVAERDHWKATAERACRRVTELLARTSELELAVESYRAELVAKESRIVDLEGVLEDQIGYVPNIKTACDGCGAPVEISEGSARLCADCDGEDY